MKLFRRKSELETLNIRYAKLMEEAKILSSTNRKESDKKVAEAQEIADRIVEILE